MSKPSILLIIGGENSRFVPFNNRTHKAGISLGGQPLLFRTLTNLQAAEYTEVVIVINPKDDQETGLKGLITQAFPELHLTFVVQPQARGMGDALLLAKPFLNDSFILSSGYHDQLASIADDLLATNEPIVVTATKTDRPQEYGILALHDGRATGIIEKPEAGDAPSNQKIQTIYLLNQDFLEILAKAEPHEYNFETALNQVMKSQSVAIYQTESLASLKYSWHLFDFLQLYFQQATSRQEAEAVIAPTAVIDDSSGPVIIEAGAQIGHASKLVGPCFIGQKAVIGDFCLIRGSSIEAGAQIGAYSEVARSIVMSGASLHYGYLADSIIGQNAKIGAGLITANKRLDRQPVSITIKNQKINTNREALGILVGDQAQIGIRVSTMPGIVIGHQATIFPDQVVYTNVLPESHSKPS